MYALIQPQFAVLLPIGVVGGSTAGGLPILLVVAGIIAIAVIGVSFYASVYNNSGRGLDTDEWEVDHSVWMDQLQRDFESSWSQE